LILITSLAANEIRVGVDQIGSRNAGG